MNSKLWIRKALTLCMMVALVATYSMVALANTGKAVGELIVTGNSSGADAPFVIVNGEAAKSGRTIFSSSTISTPDGAGAIVNLGKAGKIELAPKTNLTLSFDNASISGELSTGSLTVLNAAQSVNIKTSTGETFVLNSGETASAEGVKTAAADHRDANGTCIDDDKDGKLDCDDEGGAAWWIWAAIFGGAIAGIVIAATSDNNRIALGGGTTVVSPTR